MKKILSFFVACMLVISIAAVSLAESGITYADTISWDGEYDVVVVGFGGAGGVTAITAADEGANVLVVEKAPEGSAGGNTRVAGQIILYFSDHDKGVSYMKQLRGKYNTPTDEAIEALVNGMQENYTWLEEMGATEINVVPNPEYPEFDGADDCSVIIIDELALFTSKYWQLLERNVGEREDKIDVWYSSPAEHLIQDPFTKTILGVQVDKEGQKVNIRAKNGVVLACGGFENNPEMIQDYTQYSHLYINGSPYNTGDGVRMAQEVGADLWHMAATSGPFLTHQAYGEDNILTAFEYMKQNITDGNSVINVDGMGKRFTDESFQARHGYVPFSDTFVSQTTEGTLYTVFDETTRLAGAIFPTFSADNAAEIESGYILKGDTVEELAGKMGIDAQALQATITEYNQNCAEGVDPYFGRSAETLEPIVTAPYYAIKLVPAIVNTQGGPRRNLNGEVLDTNGNPIANLYSAGELGSEFSDMYNGGGDLAETMISGRAAGKSAAAQKEPLAPITLTAVESNLVYTINSAEEEEAAVELADNEFMGTAHGMGGNVTVKVTMDGDKIVGVEVVEANETPNIGTLAIEAIPGKIVEANSTEVEAVTGATITSKAIMEAVKAALAQVK